MIKAKIGWAPSISLAHGIGLTYSWIKEQVENEKSKGGNVSSLASSQVVVQVTDTLDSIGINKTA